MKPIPRSVYAHIDNAKYYLEVADKHPQPTQDAALALLLIAGWENIIIAGEELGAWARQEEPDPKLRKDHGFKLDQVKNDVTRVIVGPPGKGIPAQEIPYSGGKQLAKLRQMAQYGTPEEPEVRELFKTGWHLDPLRNGLIGKIQWVKVTLRAYEEIITRPAKGVIDED